MSGNFKRSDRVAEMLQRILSEVIQQEIKDPRFPAFVTVSAVKMSPDLSYAKVYFTVLQAEGVENAAHILNTASSYLRSIIAKKTKLRIVPQLHFVYDESIEYARRLNKIIEDANPNLKNDEEE